MSVGAVFFSVFGGAIAGLIAIWLLVRLYLIIRPESPLQSYIDPYEERRRLTENGRAITVGYREIYEDVRHLDSDTRRSSHTDRLFRQN